jgi:hypothetical protein
MQRSAANKAETRALLRRTRCLGRMIPIHGNRTLRLAKKIHTSRDNLLLDVLLPLDLEETLPLLCESGSLPLSHSLVLDSSGLHLLL